MVRNGIIFLMVLLVLTYKPLEAQEDNPESVEQDIPKRCRDNSVTTVSCANVISEDSLLPHPDDCELFYYCVSPDHAPICRQCPAQLHFNPNEHVCDLPEHAGCAVNATSAL